MSLSFRSRRILAIGVVLAAAAIAVPRFLTHTPYQRFGVRLDWSAPDGIPKVDDVVGPPGKGVLRKGDRLIQVEGRPISRELFAERRKDPTWQQQSLPMLIEREGRRQSVVLPPLRLSAWQRVRLFTLPLAAVVAAPLVAILLVWRRPDLNAAWVFLWFAVLQAVGTVWSLFRFPQPEVEGVWPGYLKFYDALVLWLPAAFLHFMTVFPRSRWRSREGTKSVWFWLVVAAYATPPALILASRVIDTPVDRLYLVFQSIAFPLGTLSLIERYVRRSRTGWNPRPSERVLATLLAVTLLLAAAVDLIPDDPRFIAMFSVPWVRLLYTAVFFAWLAAPLVIAYLIANDPAFDPRRLLVRSVPYALLSGVLAAIYLAVVVGAQRLFAAATGEQAVVFNVVAALIVAFAFAPLRERLQLWLDRLFGRDPRALRAALDRAGRELLGALDHDEVRHTVDAALRRGLKRPVAIEWPESGMPRLAEPEELRDEERPEVETLLRLAGIRLENLSLQSQRAQAERSAVELQEAATRAELRALHAQVQPHFLFNALNALSYLIETDPKAAQRFTERLADMLRYTVEAGQRPAALLSEEIAFVEDYLGVARERYENPLTFEYKGARELLSAAVPPLLLQPLVENSLKHGCVPGTTGMHLALEAMRDDHWLTLEFRDDGAPAAHGANGTNGLGTGLQNLEQRVRRFGGPEATMTTRAEPDGGFAVTLRWPVNGAEVP